MRLLRLVAFVGVSVGIACGTSSSGGNGSSGSSGSSGQPPGEVGYDEDGGVVVYGPDGEVIDAPPPPPPPVYVKTTHETMTFDGQTRRYSLSLPLDYDATRTYPLVLSFHGSPGTAADMVNYLPFDPASKKEAIVVYPNALLADWDLYTATDQNADIRFVQALVDTLAGSLSFDKTRVYGVGWSGGGFFINQLACRAGGLLRAIAVHAGGAPSEANDPNPPKHPNGFLKCTAGAPIATIVFHGDQDPVVGFSSGDFDATYWAYVNGCQDSRSPTTPAPCQSHDGCPASTPVTFCAIAGGGHGVAPTGFATSWAFFKALAP